MPTVTPAPFHYCTRCNTRHEYRGRSIEEGDNKPYVITDQGVYLRVGATTRRANRYEMDRFYAGKQVLGPSWR